MRRYLLVAAAVGLTTSLAGADSPASPYSYTKTTRDGRFIFVMLAQGPVEEHLAEGNPELRAEVRALREKFPKSGLYRNDGSSTSLWTVDWYAFRVEVASDGVHLVRYGPWPGKGQYDTEAISFFANGRLIKTFEVRDLVRSPDRLPQTASHYLWLKDASLDDQEMTLRLDTEGGEHYTFDVRTGEVLDQSRDLPLGVVMALCGLAVLAGVILLVMVVRRLTRPRAARPAAR